MTTSNESTVTRFARVLRVDDHIIHVSTTTGVESCTPPSIDLACGDLVRIQGGAIIDWVRPNRATRPIEEQDWWRIHRVLPVLRQRTDLLHKLRQWFLEQDFLEVDTPILTAHPGLEVHLQPIQTRVCDQVRYLITSPEFHMKRLLSAGLERIYYLGKSFRDDEKGRHHHPEFTMLEWYRTDAEPSDLMSDVETIVALATGEQRQWVRISVHEALARWGTPTDDPDDIVRQLVEYVEPNLVELGAVFLTDYPASLASLARLNSDDPTTSARFEAYVDGVELANGFGELTDPVEQRERFEQDLNRRRALGLPVFPMDESFLDALGAGLPPCAGIALGIDRLIMLATNTDRIADVVCFPPDLA